MRRALALLLLLAGAALAHEGSDALEAAGAGTQREVLRGLVAGNGHACPEVAGVFLAGEDANGAHHWDVLCRGALPHRITFGTDPERPVRVRDCLALEDWERCFEPADPRVPRLRNQFSRCIALCDMVGRARLPACLDGCLAVGHGGGVAH